MYATAQDLIDRFGEQELVDRTDTDGTGAYDAGRVDQALRDGWADVEPYLLERYPEFTDGSLVRDDVPEKVIGRQCDFARARLWDDAENEKVEKAETRAIRFLERVAEGKQKLVAPKPQAESAQSAGVSISQGRNRYDDGSLGRFQGLA